MDLQHGIELVSEVLATAEQCGSESEVMFTALRFMQESGGEYSIEEALTEALDEWVK